MTTKISNNGIGLAAALSTIIVLFDTAPAAVFAFRIDNATTNGGAPDDDGQSFQQLWTNPVNWTLVSGEDDGLNGFPDGEDTFTIDRGSLSNNSTRLTNEGVTIGTIAAITGTGTGNQDIVFKHGGDNTIVDLNLLESPLPFHIRQERDRSLTIEGIISGPGSLLLSRSGGFSDGVDEDELITITGDAPNTITGNIRLFNDNGNADNPQPSYWVADKVGAFGQAPQLTLEGRPGLGGGIASLRITANAVGGEGAIDDDATAVFIGAKGVFNMDAGVNEFIGEGLLQIDIEGTGTYTPVPNGTYTNAENWIIGEGTVTVGAPTVDLAITAIDYTTDVNGTTLSLTWNSAPGRIYAVRYSTDLENWDFDLDDGVVGEAGESTTFGVNLADFPELADESKVFFRVEEAISVGQ
ncbi:hypothetical protein N9057_04165 [Akkermansiaceae bacterium]|nr:hypothetical protein [Akkermansiaceae bacterium]